MTNETFVVTNIVYPVMIPFLSAGRTGDHVILIDVELRVVDDKSCGNPEGTKKELKCINHYIKKMKLLLKLWLETH